MATVALIAALLILLRVWLDRDKDPRSVAVFDGPRDDFIDDLERMLHAVEANPEVLKLTDAEIAAITDEMGRDE